MKSLDPPGTTHDQPAGQGEQQLSPAFIFLDVDGVLNSMRSMTAFRGAGVGDLDLVALGLLDRLAEALGAAGYEPRVVISSTWRMMHPLKSWWASLFEDAGCQHLVMVASTPIFQDNDRHRRGREVAHWMERYGGGAPYVALDDDRDFLPEQPLVLIDADVGLQIADIDAAYWVITGQSMPGLPRIFRPRRPTSGPLAERDKSREAKDE